MIVKPAGDLALGALWYAARRGEEERGAWAVELYLLTIDEEARVLNTKKVEEDQGMLEALQSSLPPGLALYLDTFWGCWLVMPRVSPSLLSASSPATVKELLNRLFDHPITESALEAELLRRAASDLGTL